MKRILFTTPCGPYDVAWGKNTLDLLDARLARGHGIVGMEGELYAFALHLIAENLTNPCTVLEFPGQEDFVREILKGYDMICIQMKAVDVPKVAKMVEIIRDVVPKVEIVIGGYGLMSSDSDLPWDTAGHAAYINTHADHFCRTEGVRFMRELLGDAPVDRPITQHHIPPCEFSIPNVYPARLRIPIILVSLGCPNACNFCATSAFFKHKKIYVAEPAEVYGFMKNYQQRLGATNLTFLLYDEDFLLNEDYVRELGRLIRSDPKTWGLRWISFASIKAVSAFEPEELVKCGAAALWIGVESGFSEEGKSRTGYDKRNGAKSPPQVFEALRQHGIGTIGSAILGFDFHTPENIMEDINYFVNLRPTFYQIAPLSPCPGTPLYDEMLAKERMVLDHYTFENCHIWRDDLIKMENFADGEIKRFYDLAHDQLYSMNGPPVIQLYENALNTCARYGNSADDFLRYQADQAHQVVRLFGPMLGMIKCNPPSPRVRERLFELEARTRAVFPDEPLPIRAVQKLLERVFDLRINRLDRHKQARPSKDPKVRWTYFGKGNGRAPERVVGDKRIAGRFNSEMGGKSMLGSLRLDLTLMT